MIILTKILSFLTGIWPGIKSVLKFLWNHKDKVLIAVAAGYLVYLITAVKEKQIETSPIDNYDLLKKAEKVLKE